MAIDIRKPLQSALSRLKSEKDRIDKQIAAIEGVLGLDGGERDRRGAKRGRKSMSTAERRAVSRRMKKYWAKRHANGRKKRAA
jgi:hypothetical protein